MDRAERERMREEVAKEYGFKLYRQYGEAEAAVYLDVDISTLKRWRREGRTPYINLGERKVRYLGYMVADMILGAPEWNEPSSAGNTTSPSLENPQTGTEHGLTPPPDKPNVSALARQTFKKPRSS